MNYCPGCALKMGRLRAWRPYCRRLTVSWLHVLIAAALDAAFMFGLLIPSQGAPTSNRSPRMKTAVSEI